MKLLIFLGTLLVAGAITLNIALQNGSLKKYLDTHRDPQKLPVVEFYLGEGYYLLRDLQNSATYYQRVSDHYPKSSYADSAYFNYLNALDEMDTPRAQMADLYSGYLERFPQGQYLEIAQKRFESCRNGR